MSYDTTARHGNNITIIQPPLLAKKSLKYPNLGILKITRPKMFSGVTNALSATLLLSPLVWKV